MKTKEEILKMTKGEYKKKMKELNNITATLRRK